MTADPLVRAIEAAAEALAVEAKWCDDNKTLRDDKVDAKLAVDAAAPHLTRFQGSLLQIAQERAERAEAGMEAANAQVQRQHDALRAERALADLLAKALRDVLAAEVLDTAYELPLEAALAAYEAARSTDESR